MSKIDVVVVGNGIAYVSNSDPVDGETVTLTCTPDTGETIDDVEAWDSSAHPVAFAPVPSQSFVWYDSTYGGAMTIKVTFSGSPTPPTPTETHKRKHMPIWMYPMFRR